jgi:hypothetical protein
MQRIFEEQKRRPLYRKIEPRRGAANFCASAFKPLDRSFGYALRGFQAYPSKIVHAQNEHNM